MNPWRALTYATSWLRAEGVGLTVCRALGHREPDFETTRFANYLADLLGHSPDSDLRQPSCTRCGGLLRAA